MPKSSSKGRHRLTGGIRQLLYSAIFAVTFRSLFSQRNLVTYQIRDEFASIAIPPSFSYRWLHGTRLPNMDDVDPGYVHKLILSDSPFVLEQSLAFEESSFVNREKNERCVCAFRS